MAKNLICSMFVAVGFVGLIGCGDDHDHSKHDHGTPAAKSPETPAAPADSNAKPYPLKTCIVSGEELGKMGEPMRFTYKGQEIKLCCKGCEKKFHADADKFLEKIAAAPGK
jgi:hypothetical protein